MYWEVRAGEGWEWSPVDFYKNWIFKLNFIEGCLVGLNVQVTVRCHSWPNSYHDLFDPVLQVTCQTKRLQSVTGTSSCAYHHLRNSVWIVIRPTGHFKTKCITSVVILITSTCWTMHVLRRFVPLKETVQFSLLLFFFKSLFECELS